MIPIKLYIPTTTLNFNNIMASESISPAGFYSVRNFGYKRFDKVEPNKLDKRIILYDKYPNFNIDDVELENYPLVIEISPNDVNEDIIREHKDGVFYSEETIYLNPFSTKLYFRNEEEKRRTLSRVEQSLNTKMGAVYQNCICIKESNLISFEWRNSDIADSTTDFAKYISKDRRINKLKGFLYAYLLGANRSLSNEIVVLKKYVKELRNTISAIITNPDGYANYKQKEELESLYQKINNAFLHADKIDETIQNLLKQKAEEYNCPNFVDILRKENLYQTWFQLQDLKPSYRVRPFNLPFSYKSYFKKKDNKYNNNDAEKNQEYFDNYFTEIDNAIGKYIKSTNISIEELPVLLHCNRVDSIPADKTGFQVKLFNEYADESWNNEEFLASRLDFATAGGKLFKKELGDSWENNPSKAYINNLRNNLASHTPFVLKSMDNLTLQSFAVFCQKGEEDVNKLEEYLISNGIANFRIAFSLWGLVFGFANMPKTLTNDLFLSNDNIYKSEVYKYIFKQIHGIELEGVLENRKKELEILVISSQLNREIKETKQELTVVNKRINIEDSSLDLEIKLLSCNLKPEQLESIKEGYKQNKNTITKSLFDYIIRIPGIGEKKLQKIKDSLEYAEPCNNKTSISKSPSFLEQIPVGKDFYKDENVFSYIELVLPKEKKIRKQFKADLDWFQENYRESYKNKGNYTRGCYCDKSKDNASVIEQFNRYLENKRNNKDEPDTKEWLRKIYHQIDIEKITFKLKELYL